MPVSQIHDVMNGSGSLGLLYLVLFVLIIIFCFGMCLAGLGLASLELFHFGSGVLAVRADENHFALPTIPNTVRK